MSALGPASEPVELLVSPDQAGQRLDAFLAGQLPVYSRVLLRRAITAGGVTVNGRGSKAARHLVAGDRVRLVLPDLPRQAPRPEDIPLEILYEDEALVLVNKPAGMVVHPARGHWSGTLAGALAFHFQQLSGRGGPTRPGIVHRLDRDTSGVLAVAKTDETHMLLSEQFESRQVEKEYLAIVCGAPDRDRDVIRQPIGPHPYQREKMAIRSDHPNRREAQTYYEVQERFRGYAVVRVLPKTGRTHQIRLHLGHVGCPVLCDRLYGGRSQVTRGELAPGAGDEVILARQALHAVRLSLVHPLTRQPLSVEAPLPEDLRQVLAVLRGGESPTTG